MQAVLSQTHSRREMQYNAQCLILFLPLQLCVCVSPTAKIIYIAKIHALPETEFQISPVSSNTTTNSKSTPPPYPVVASFCQRLGCWCFTGEHGYTEGFFGAGNTLPFNVWT